MAAAQVCFGTTIILSILGWTGLARVVRGKLLELRSGGPQGAGGELGRAAHERRNFRTVALSPWLLIPVLFVVATVMTFMFLGDGLRAAADTGLYLHPHLPSSALVGRLMTR